MNLLAIWLFASSVLSLLSGVYSYFNNRSSSVNRTWFVCCMTVTLFCFSLANFLISPDKSDALLWNKISHIFMIFIPVSFLQFVVNFLRVYDGQKKLVEFSYVAGLLLAVFTPASFFIKDLAPKINFTYWLVPGSFYVFLPLFFWLEVIYAVYLLITSYRRATVFRRNQMSYIIVGSVVGFISISTNFLLDFGIPLFPFGNYFLILYILIITYPVTFRRLMEINIAFNRVVFFLSVIVIVAVYTFIVRLLYPFLGHILFIGITPLLVAAILSFAPSRKRLAFLLDKIFYRGRFDYQDILQKASRELVKILDITELLNYILRILVENLTATKVAIFLFDEEKGVFQIKAAEGIEERVSDEFLLKRADSIILWLRKHKEAFVKEEMEFFYSPELFGKVYDGLYKVGAEVILPLFYKEDIIGFLTLGYKQREGIYSHRDIEVLTNLSGEISQAIRNAQLYLGAITDGLTGLYDRRYLDRRLSEEIERARTFKHPLSFIIIDVDHFKELNDIYGHMVGDLILKDISRILKRSLRKVDILFRYGGEEFAVISPETDLEGAKIEAERLRRAIEEHKFIYEGEELNLTISIGIGLFVEGMDKDRLIEIADAGLYKAKEEGRNRVGIADDFNI